MSASRANDSSNASRLADWVVFECSHRRGRTRASHGVKEAGHGHGDQPDADDPVFG